MSTTLIVHWGLWGASLLAGAGAIGALFKLRLAERSLPAWSELQETNAQLSLLREEQRQAGEAVSSQREALAELESEVGPLLKLREWQDANPDAPARLQKLAAALEHANAELTAVQQNVNRLKEESARLTEQVLLLRNQVGSLEKQKAEMAKGSAKKASPPAKRKRKARQPAVG
jgi:chromosome segregation ATPase